MKENHNNKEGKTANLFTLGLLICCLFFNINTAKTQVVFDQTYPFLFPKDSNGLRTFPDFDLQQSINAILLTECLEGEWTTLQLNNLSGELVEVIPLPTIPCGGVPLSNGSTLAIEYTTEGDFGYMFTNYNPLGLIQWQRTYTNIPFFLSTDNVIPDPSGGFYIYNRSPFRLISYGNDGQLLYDRRSLNMPETHGGKIVQVEENGDLYVRIGHLGGNDQTLIIAKIDGSDGQALWEQEIPTVRNLSQDTQVSVTDDFPLVVVNNNFGSIVGNGITSGGWDISFLDKETGELLSHYEKLVGGNCAVLPVIDNEKGVFLLEEQFIENEEDSEDKTGFALYHYNINGVEQWRKPLFSDIPFSTISLPIFEPSLGGDLLLLGTKNDSLWMVKLDPDGNLYTAPDNDSAPDLALTISADKNELPLYGFLTFTLTVRNEGKNTADLITINAPFVDYQTLTSTTEQSATRGEYFNWSGNWELGSLAAGEEATLTVKTFVLSDQPTVRYISVTDQKPSDWDESNNSIVLRLPYTGLQMEDGFNFSLDTSFNDWQVQAFPQHLKIDLDNSNAMPSTFAIFNTQGQLMQKHAFDLIKGQQTIEFSLGQLTAGMYILQQLETGKGIIFNYQQ